MDVVLKKINVTVTTTLSPTRILKWFMFFQALVWTLVPYLSRASLHHDVLEGITQGLQFQWGYSKHPFLSMWVLAFVWKLLGGHEWAIYALSQGVVGLGVYYSWKLNQRWLPAWHALIATLLLSTLFFYTLEANVLTPDNFQIPIWTAILYFYDRVVTDKKLKDWAYLGLWMGLGVLIKYQVAILLISLVLVALIHGHKRVLLLHPGLALTLMVMMVVIAPNGLWLYQHWDVFSAYMQSEVHNYDNFSLFHLICKYFNNILGVGVVPALVMALAFPKRQSKWEWGSSARVFDIYAYSLSPFVVTLLFLCFSLTPIYGRWLTPYYSVWGALLVYWWRPIVTEVCMRRFLGLLGLMTVIMALWVSTPQLNKNPKCDAYYPNQDISHFITKIWDKNVHKPLKYLAGSRYLVASTVPYISPQPVPYFSLSQNTSPWVVEGDVLKYGAAFVWDVENNYTWDVESMRFNAPPEDLFKRFPAASPIALKTFYTQQGRAIKIAYSILRPQ